ncbi:MAG: hypothetical protein PUE13_09525 [Clostridiales bacterium]|nr:hypothetical protein [Clostridiales bacterium]
MNREPLFSKESTEELIKRRLTITALVMEINEYSGRKYECINEIVRFEDPIVSNNMFMWTNNGSLHFGEIYNIYKKFKDRKEIWTIESSKAVITLRIIKKPTWTRVKKSKKLTDQERFELKKSIDKLCNNLLLGDIVRDILKK